jgi:hypothetical protein
MRKIKTIKPRGEAGRTVATLYDEGITYNETGVTFNDAIAYGGIYNYGMDLKPIISLVRNRKPSIKSYDDIQDTETPILYRGMPMGPGFFLYITYPTPEAIFT